MLETDLSRYQEALRRHPSVHQVEIDGGTLVITAQAANPWVLVAANVAPGSLPIFFLRDPQALSGRLAHVNYNGEICFTDREGISIDADEPVEVLLAAFGEALAVLDRSLSLHQSGDLTDFNDELEGYWQSVPAVSTAPTHVNIDQLTTREIDVYVSREGLLGFADRRMEASYGSFQRLTRDKSLRRDKGLYIPLSGGIELPNTGKRLSAAHVVTWAKHARDTPGLQRLLKSWPRRVNEAFIIFSQPRSNGSLSAIAVKMKGKTGRHPLIDHPDSWTAAPIIVQRHAPSHMRIRGGATELSARHVVIVGGGSVGGRVVEQLAQAGIGKLTCIDPEKLDADNPYRHVLGSEFCGAYKATALQVSLQRRLPGLQLIPVTATLDDWLASADLNNIDGIVIAVGSPSIERAFNRSHWSVLKADLPYVTTWLEPLGLGGHAQLTRAGKQGCLECLYTDSGGDSRLHPKTAYTQPGQRISRNLTGCGGAFTPYSNQDAVDTASRATRLMLAALEGRKAPTYVAWRGPDDAATAAGIQTTPWYTSADADRAAREYSCVQCPVCGGER